MAVRSWTFAQLTGNKTVLELGGWQAPFGRPRHDPIVNEGISVRHIVTWYPDANAPVEPDVHSFGTENKPFELKGRWMDRAIQIAGGAAQYKRKWKDFVSQQQVVRAKWGEILSYKIFIHDIDLHVESDSDIAWKLIAVVLLDEQAPVAVHQTPAKTPIDIATEMAALLSQKPLVSFSAPSSFSLRGFLGSITDTIDLLVGAINTPFQTVFQICSDIADFETALSTDLFALGSGLQTMQTAIINLRDATDVAIAQQALLQNEITTPFSTNVFSGPDQTSLYAAKIQNDADNANLLALIADMQLEIAKAVRGEKAAAVRAQDGDSWESIATSQFGDPSGAGAIRDMNAVRYGARPQPGATYHIPKRS